MQTALESTFHQVRGMYYDTALSTNDTILSTLQRQVPISHLLLGSDYPLAQEVGTRYALEGLATYSGFSTQERNAIESENALMLFPRFQA